MTGGRSLGIAPRGINVAELDALASEQGAPHGIITVDCSNPYEIDDGIQVQELPLYKDTYRVRVFSVDTSGLYADEETTRALELRTESRYANPGSPIEEYVPMLDPNRIQELQFKEGKIRSALVVSFVIGQEHAPTDVSVEFGRVEVFRNYAYNRFAKKVQKDPSFKRYARAADLIVRHLGGHSTNPDGDTRTTTSPPNLSKFRFGADINARFMIAANHLVALELSGGEGLGIFRIHDPQDLTHAEIMPPEVARFSSAPGPHVGLGINPYARVTSPLRRADDYVNLGVLRQAKQDKINGRDKRIIETMVRILNQSRVAAIHAGRLSGDDTESWND